MPQNWHSDQRHRGVILLTDLAGKEFGYGQNIFPAEVFPAGQTLFYIGSDADSHD
jgi:hypothetical protein